MYLAAPGHIVKMQAHQGHIGKQFDFSIEESLFGVEILQDGRHLLPKCECKELSSRHVHASNRIVSSRPHCSILISQYASYSWMRQQL